MEITCRLVKYQYNKHGTPISLDWFDSEDELSNQDIKVDCELQVIALPIHETEDAIILAKSDRFKRELTNKFTNIHFYGITYTYRHMTDEIYCLTLIHKI